jgi:ATP-binding cassette subfamily F protein uup
MDLILNCQSVSKSYSSRHLFENLSMGISRGGKVGIIGPNGSGKSTLLKIFAGLEKPDAGEIVLQRGSKISFVGQSVSFPSDATISSALRTSALEAKAAPEDVDGLCKVLLGKAGFENPNALVNELSGGWKKRLEICCGLVGEPDLVLLDEPTNHLDIDGIWWLEQILKNARFSWIVVSHDRAFLENTVSSVSEINKQFAEGILTADGTYQNFLDERLRYFDSQSRQEESLANKAKRELEWLRRGPKARSTKARYRIDSAEAMQTDLSDMRSRLRVDQAKIEFADSGRKSKKLVSIEGVTKTLGDKRIVEDLEIELAGGTKIGILGRNGTGKSTILKLLAKVIEPDRGEVKHVQGLNVVYFDQNRESVVPEWTLKRTLCEAGDHVIFQDRSIHVISWAKRFLFSPEHLDKRIMDLSGGERAKAIIAKLMLQKADLLLLDEPTNDIDISTMETLEDGLLDFPGAVVLVSHDRFMLQKVCSSFIGLDGSGKATIYADYDQWESTLKPDFSTKKDKKRAQDKAVPGAKAKKLSYNEQREYDGMEDTILVLENQMTEKREMTEKPELATDSKKLDRAFAELNACQEKLDKHYARWAELEAMLR